MMKTSHSRFIFEAPFNSLSFGQVSINLCFEMFKRNMDVSIFPISNPDFTSYNYLPSAFFEWFNYSVKSRYNNIDKETKSIKLWHLLGSEKRITNKNYLYTFHELSDVTEYEKTVCSFQEKTIFSSSYSRHIFDSKGVKDTDNCFVGFDPNIKLKNKTYFDDCVHFILVGKWEKRKNTELIINTWANKFGNKKDYKLTCLVQNPFFDKDLMESLINKSLNGKKYFNITFLPRLNNNLEVFDLYNSCDIDLSGLSSAEGWNLPSFNSTCLGKWSLVLNHTAHKDWADQENSILIDVSKKREAYDETFFRKGEIVNQGDFFELERDTLEFYLDYSLKFYKKTNQNGLLLQDKFSYEKMLSKIFQICEI